MREGRAHKACSFKRSPFFSLQSSSPSREERSSLGGELRYLEGLQKFFHFFCCLLERDGLYIKCGSCVSFHYDTKRSNNHVCGNNLS